MSFSWCKNFYYQIKLCLLDFIGCFQPGYENTWFREGLIFKSNMYYKYSIDYEALFLKINCNLSIGAKIQASKNPIYLFNDHFKNTNCIDIYTDGSKIENTQYSSVGFAYWSANKNLNGSFKLPPVTSVYTAECLAMLYAINNILTYVNSHSNINEVFRIFSDSQSLVRSLYDIKGLDAESPLVVQIRHKLLLVNLKDIIVKIYWIPAHKGIPGNEQADQKAKDAAVRGKMANIDIPHSDFILTYKLICKKEFQEEIFTSRNETGSFFFNNLHENDVLPWFKNCNLNRKTITIINRLRCNHSSLNSSLYKFKIVDSDLCKCNKAPDTADHIFFNCEIFQKESKELIRKLNKAKIMGPYSIYSLIFNLNPSIINFLSKFIEKTKINI